MGCRRILAHMVWVFTIDFWCQLFVWGLIWFCGLNLWGSLLHSFFFYCSNRAFPKPGRLFFVLFFCFTRCVGSKVYEVMALHNAKHGPLWLNLWRMCISQQPSASVQGRKVGRGGSPTLSTLTDPSEPSEDKSLGWRPWWLICSTSSCIIDVSGKRVVLWAYALVRSWAAVLQCVSQICSYAAGKFLIHLNKIVPDCLKRSISL